MMKTSSGVNRIIKLFYSKLLIIFRQKYRLTIAFNLHARLTGIQERLFYDKLHELYEIRFSPVKRVWKCKSPKVIQLFYWRGLKARGRQIGESYFLDKVSFLEHDTVIDCGANYGDLYLYFLEKKIEINYIAFEPSPPEYRCLKANVHGKQIFDLGLWNESALANFYISFYNADSSYIRPPHVNKIIQSDRIRLDSISILQDKKIKLLKVEAEGGEPEVIEGALGVLPSIEFIAVDLGFERGIHQENTISPVMNFLLKHNFQLLYAVSPRGRMTFLFRNLQM